MTDMDVLRRRAAQAHEVLTRTHETVASLELVIDERVETSLPLILGSLDHASTILDLFVNRADRSWVSALALQRSQMEYVLRAAFFAKAASEKEIRRFRVKGKMPNRGKQQIYIANVADEAADHLGWDKQRLIASVRAHQRELSKVVHGGNVIIAIYTSTDEWGTIDTDWTELAGHVDTIVVYMMLAMAVAMSLSGLNEVQMDKVVRPAYDAAHAYFKSVGSPLED
jgi:hypothetical protein